MTLFEEISSCTAESKSFFHATRTDTAFPLCPSNVLVKKIAEDRSEENPVGFPGQPIKDDDDVCEMEPCTKADIVQEDIDVVGSAPVWAVFGFESEVFSFSEIVRRKGLIGPTLTDGVVSTSQLAQCEFSNLQILPLT